MASVTIKPNQRVVRISEYDILHNSKNYSSHRHYIAQKFQEMGFEVTEWHTRYNGDIKIVQGLEYLRADSDITLIMEVVGTIGVNIRPLRGEVLNAEGNSVQAESAGAPERAETPGDLVLQSPAGSGSGNS